GASPVAAVAIGGTFGLVRGSAVYLGRSATSPAALGEVHARLDAFGPTARLAALVVQLLAAVTLAGAAWGLGPAAVLAVASAAAVAVANRSPRDAVHA
ncbi:MAG TPA: hypothetical protein VNS19_09725, partial [Acidimicrobiales bacterium]|nr:hypothetical protein [Acidimicrobiales bacterium]